MVVLKSNARTKLIIKIEIEPDPYSVSFGPFARELHFQKKAVSIRKFK